MPVHPSCRGSTLDSDLHDRHLIYNYDAQDSNGNAEKWRETATLLVFFKGHWEDAKDVHGDKRNPDDMKRWRGLAKIGIQTDRHLLNEQADVLEDFRGPGNLEPGDMALPTL
ncbi:uncharacterized protein N7511_008109 [Penicillium nucicola]|uniref:uncharacterized protein n=1 Tax=Penicillium nucicola TaxID=1850975 RepID=UPI0025455CE5|nr:uncharacterized protein N7511_008109 [Penicillium nucicola]KAJ5753956.1 hypothetical protein N7511_008109 [Penicillium nucicola]